MCPATIALIGTAASAGGKLLGGISSARADHFQAEVARQNAQIAQQNAQRAAMATSSQTTIEGLKVRAHNAGVRAGIAASGVDVSSGSAVDVQESERRLGAFDVANTSQSGALKTYGYETQAAGDLSQASLDQSKVVPDALGGALGAVSAVAGNASLLSGPSNGPSALSSDYSWMQNDMTLQQGETGQPTDVHILDF